MNLLQTFSIDEMLSSRAINFNQSKLARMLNINRHTLRKHMKDVNCENHLVIVIDGGYKFASIRGFNNAT